MPEILDYKLEQAEYVRPVYGNFFERVMARIIDLVIIAIPGMIVPIILPWLYFSLMESSSMRATIGKRAMGLTVQDLQGNQLTFGRATGRYFVNFINLFTFFIGYLMMFFSERRQCLHDIIVDTEVVRGGGQVLSYRPQTPRSARTRQWLLQTPGGEPVKVTASDNGVQLERQTSMGPIVSRFTLEAVAERSADFSWLVSEADFIEIQGFAQFLLKTKR